MGDGPPSTPRRIEGSDGRPRQGPPQYSAAIDVAGRHDQHPPDGRRYAPRLRAPAVPRDDADRPRGAPRPHALQPPAMRRRAPREARGLSKFLIDVSTSSEAAAW